MEAHTLLCYAAIVRHFHSQLTDVRGLLLLLFPHYVLLTYRRVV